MGKFIFIILVNMLIGEKRKRKKNLPSDVDLASFNGWIERETRKAYLYRFDFENKTVKIWFPKSLTTDGKIPFWLFLRHQKLLENGGNP